MSRALVMVGSACLALLFWSDGGQPDALQPAAAVPPAHAPGGFSEKQRGDLTPSKASWSNYQPPAGFAPSQFTFNGQDRTWYGLGPTPSSAKRPTIILLHGSGRDGRSLLDMWQDVARSHNLVLIAPNALNSNSWHPSRDGEDFLNKLLDEAAEVHAVDKSSVYIFGHSAGANYALFLANRGKRPWRAIGAHAGSYIASKPATSNNPTPLFIYVGDQDHIFKLQPTRAAAKSLSAVGHQVSFTVIPSHTHWFYEIGPAVARDAWAEMKEY